MPKQNKTSAGINNKHDGFLDDLLPGAKIVVNRKHAEYKCGGHQSEVPRENIKDASAAVRNMTSGGMWGDFEGTPLAPPVAYIGPGCSGDVEALTNKERRAQEGDNAVVISGSSTAPSLRDDEKYPSLVRFSTPESKAGAGFAKICELYNWKRVGIIHDDTLWASAAEFWRDFRTWGVWILEPEFKIGV